MQAIVSPDTLLVATDVARALAEDIGSGDVTASLLPAERRASASVTAREAATIAGMAWFDACFAALDATSRVNWAVHDGEEVAAGSIVCTIEGHARALVSAERCALNFLQTLSGTATTTAAYVRAVAGTGATILDTRKTIPGLRLAQKYAVRCGGGSNHRIGLYDAVLIKENHIAAAGSIAIAVERARAAAPGLLLEVEVETLAQLDEALASHADRILIDDVTLADMRLAVARAAGACPLEVSGGVSLETVRAIADTGVDFISVGALTKHVRAVDLSMRVAG
ncbi:MAG TPA: carboxylating nicotinate-nucleotide diphosphorylase [Candidatus Saccharimonadia bacterium]|nr:carboxylating nicotinate-nucleotide diphosphorylase [Candidatus Saccharimonadia bacterium]